MKIYVIDTETTGLDAERDRVVDLGAVKVIESAGAWNISDGRHSLVNPHRPIPPEASAVHHLVDDDVADAPGLIEALDMVLGPFWPNDVDIVAAHNARFDRDFLLPLRDRRWIDTWRCALHIWPDAPSHKNQVLRYWLGLRVAAFPHSALGDAVVTAHILVRLLAERSVDDLLKLSTKAVVLRKVGFGKHFGSLWTEVPSDYLSWAAKQDFESDVKFTIKSELARRRA